MKLLIKFASRSRFDKLMACLKNIRKLAKGDYHILLTLDTDDASIDHLKLSEYQNKYGGVTIVYGASKSKVHAINRDINIVSYEWDVLLNMSDDMVFTEPGFDLQILEEFKNFKGLLHLPDGFANERLVTMAIMHREYYKKFGYIYHPSYISLWCDNEQTDVAKLLNEYKYVNKRLFYHDHPNNTGVALDLQYRHTESFYSIDGTTYHERKQNNFGLPIRPSLD